MAIEPIVGPPKRKRPRGRPRKERPDGQQAKSKATTKSLDAVRGLRAVTFKDLISEFHKEFSSVVAELVGGRKVIYHLGRFYRYNEDDGTYYIVEKDYFIDNIIAPLLLKRKIAMGRSAIHDLYYHLAAVVPPTGDARDKITKSKMTDKFDIRGNSIKMMAMGKDQLLEITDEGEIRIIDGRTSDHFFISSMPVPAALDPVEERPELWQQYLNDAFPDDPLSWQMLDEIVGCVIYKPDLPNIILCLIGQGGSGKGVLTRLLINLVGEHPHFETSQLIKLSSRFTATAYWDKRLMILSDLQEMQKRTSRMMESLAILKNLTGDDGILLERKGVDPYTVVPHIVPIMSTNFKALNWISSAEDAGAWLRRIVPVSFQYPKEEKDHIVGFEKQIATPEMVRWCLQAYARVRLANNNYAARSMFTRSKSSLELEDSLRGNKVMTPDAYVDSHFVRTDNKSDWILAADVHALLEGSDVRKNALQPVSIKKVLREHMGWSTGKLPRKRIDGDMKYVYRQLKWKRSKVERDASDTVEKVSTGIGLLDWDPDSIG